MFKGFFDESGKTQEDSHLILAGWTASVDDWERFTESWDKCLRSHPRIEYFKFSEAARLGGQFGQFDQKSVDIKKLALAELVNSHNLRGYVTSARHSLLAGKPKQLKKMMATRIYDWAFMDLVVLVLADRCERMELAEKIDLVFDKCSELEACRKSYDRQRLNFPFLLQQIAGTVTPGDDRELSGLQAADFLAGELSSYRRASEISLCYKVMLKGKTLVQSITSPPKKLQDTLQYARNVYSTHELLTSILKRLRKQGVNLKNPSNADFDKFNSVMEEIFHGIKERNGSKF